MQFIDLKAQQALIREKIDLRIKKVLDHGKYIMGPEVHELEERLSNYVSIKHCISCSSGTDALLIPLMAMNIGPGDAVLTTPFTYIATAEVIALIGATPVFCDIYDKTFNINPEELQKAYDMAISKNLKPKAIMPVDLFGLPARYRLIEKFAEYNDLKVIEDAAQGFGGKINEKKAGSFGDVAATSFFPAKPLGCYGDGGAIFTNDDELAHKMKSIRVHGGGADKYENVRLGINGRLDTIQAAILLAKLGIFDHELKQRAYVANYYHELLSDWVQTPVCQSNMTSSWAIYTLNLTKSVDRKQMQESLGKNGIPTAIYYPIPMHLQKPYERFPRAKFGLEVSERLAQTVLSIPMHPYLKKEAQQTISNAVIDIIKTSDGN